MPQPEQPQIIPEQYQVTQQLTSHELSPHQPLPVQWHLLSQDSLRTNKIEQLYNSQQFGQNHRVERWEQ